ncbi:YciI family protein [Terrarubrum flagellatum]|uniref:YciI family protein n=1 Tax=Terrirubrum flagellatum TaxID=2895980 RepID=UPI003144D413
MPRYVVIFEDDSSRDWIRKEHNQAHFDYLGAHRDEILIAGGLRPDWGEWFDGGLWVCEAESKARVAELAEADPYFTLGLRKAYRIKGWGKAPIYDQIAL